MFVATLSLIALTLGGAAFRVRRVIDPACPACAQRAWKYSPAALLCGSCGWTNLPASEPAAAEPQPEISLAEARRAA